MDVKDIVPWHTYEACKIRKDELPVTGKSHGWDEVGDDEWEVIRIIDKRLEELPGARVPSPSYLVVYKENGKEYSPWMLASQLRTPDLIREYDATHPDSKSTIWRPRQKRYPKRNKPMTQRASTAFRTKKQKKKTS